MNLHFSNIGAIKALFERTERQHGDLFARRTLAYITAAKSGLTESELEDILSCDDEVLEDVYQYWVRIYFSAQNILFLYVDPFQKLLSA